MTVVMIGAFSGDLTLMNVQNWVPLERSTETEKSSCCFTSMLFLVKKKTEALFVPHPLQLFVFRLLSVNDGKS